ncbi:MAG: SseB family protein [Actinomycetota bacterium]|nr:SseB family protein [Actinomycetota bacterium]
MSDAVERRLPGHIAAALAGAGGPADSAGQPWQGRRLPPGAKYHNFEDDDGGTDPVFAAALAALAAGGGDEASVVRSLAGVRVFVPIVAQVAEAGVDGVDLNSLASDKESDMALVTLQAPDGRRTLPVFSSVEALNRWHPQTRPVAVYAPRAALAAVAEEAQLMVVDPGSEHPFVVRRPAVWALAQQREWIPSYSDQQVDAVLAGSLTAAGHPALLGITGRAGSGAGPELRVELTLAPGLDQAALNTLIGTLQDYWSRDGYFAESVDSVEIALCTAQPPRR